MHDVRLSALAGVLAALPIAEHAGADALIGDAIAAGAAIVVGVLAALAVRHVLAHRHAGRPTAVAP